MIKSLCYQNVFLKKDDVVLNIFFTALKYHETTIVAYMLAKLSLPGQALQSRIMSQTKRFLHFRETRLLLHILQFELLTNNRINFHLVLMASS